MKNIKIIFSLIIAASVFYACDEENLFDTVEAPAPTVTSTNWSVSAIDTLGGIVHTTGFAEAGRLFRLPGPNNDSTSTFYRDINVKASFNSGDSRTIDSVTIELRWIPSFPSNAPQPWSVYHGYAIPAAERSTTHEMDYTYNLDEWMDDYACFNYITGTRGGCGFTNWNGIPGAFGLTITREDNMMRTTLHFDDGTKQTIAQVQFSLPRLSSGLN
ncbi:MAG: hypothetical protein JXR10_15065 [Cyclobacteriaceae bacterium]